MDSLSSTDESSLILYNVLIYKSKLTTNYYFKRKQSIYIKNSYILDSTLQLIGYESVNVLHSCSLENTEIELMFNSDLSATYIINSNLIHVNIKSNIWYQQINGLLLIQSTIFQYGSISGVLTGVDISIEKSKLTYISIESSETNEDSSIALFTLRNSIYHHGSISMIDHQTNLISSYISLDKSPLILGDKSKILCSTITRAVETNFNLVGVEGQHVFINGSSIYSFEIGIRMSKSSIISSSNIYANSLYNIENQGEYDIQASGNWWGTYVEKHISDKINDYHDKSGSIGKVIYADYSYSIIEHQNSDCSEDFLVTFDGDTKETIINNLYKSISSINYPGFDMFYCIVIVFFQFFLK